MFTAGQLPIYGDVKHELRIKSSVNSGVSNYPCFTINPKYPGLGYMVLSYHNFLTSTTYSAIAKLTTATVVNTHAVVYILVIGGICRNSSLILKTMATRR